MTIAAGFRFSNGLLLCADTQITTPGFMKQAASKLIAIDFVSNGGSKALFAIAGDVAFSHMAVEHCRRALAAQSPDRMATADIMQTIEETLQGFFEDHLFRHPHFQSGQITVHMLIAIWSHQDQNLTLLSARENAVTIVRDYECLGAGQFLTNYLIPTMFRHPHMELAHAVHIALHVFRETKKYVDSCGFGTEMVVLKKDGNFGMADAIDTASGEQISEAYSQAIRRLFVSSADTNIKEDDLRQEFEAAFKIVQAARAQLLREHDKNNEHLSEMVKNLFKGMLDYKIIKS